MAQFGGILPGFQDANDNAQAVDPETAVGREPGYYNPPNTGAGSQSEAVRLARRGGSVAPPITNQEGKQGWVPTVNNQDMVQRARIDAKQEAIRKGVQPKENISDLQVRTDGRQARDQGQPISDCPYSAGSKAQYHWVSGWMQPKSTDGEDAS